MERRGEGVFPGRGWGQAEWSVLGFRRWEAGRIGVILGGTGQGSWPGRARRALFKGPTRYQDLVPNAQGPGTSSIFVSSGPFMRPYFGVARSRGEGSSDPSRVRTCLWQNLRQGVTLSCRAVLAGAVRGAATWLALRAGVPDRGRHYDAAVPAQALRRPSYPSLLVGAFAFSVHLHQDFGAHERQAGRDPGKGGAFQWRSRKPRGGGSKEQTVRSVIEAGPGRNRFTGPQREASGKARPSKNEGTFEAWPCSVVV